MEERGLEQRAAPLLRPLQVRVQVGNVLAQVHGEVVHAQDVLGVVEAELRDG